MTSLRGTTFTWSFAGPLLGATDPIPAAPESYEVDAYRRRVKRTSGTDVEFYVYEGANRTAVLDASGAVRETYLFAGVDDPLRFRRDTTTAYYETDIAGNVRRLRGPGGTDLGGYRYTAFGKAYAADPGTPAALVDQPLRWKARWFSAAAGGIYDVRARQWSPELGAFLATDEYVYQDPRSTLWGWPGQNPARWSDPTGRWPQEVWGLKAQAEGGGYGPREAAVEAATVATGVALEGSAVTEGGIALWGALQRLGPAGRIIAALLGGPMISNVAPMAEKEASGEECSAAAQSEAEVTGNEIRDIMQQLNRGVSSNARIRTVGSPDELNALFEKLSQGGSPTTLENYNGQAVRLVDGTVVGLRATSASGGETIDVFTSGGGNFKVHIQ